MNSHNLRDLKDLKIRWYEDALSSGKFRSLSFIGEVLGEPLRHNYGPKYRFEVDGYVLFIDHYGNYLTMHKDSKLCCSTHNERLYIPAICDPFIEQYAPKANEIKNEAITSQMTTEFEKLQQELWLI